LGKEIQALAADYQEVRAQIRVASPRYAALTQPQPLTLAEIQKQVLDADTLLLAYSLGEERSFLWAVTPNSIHSYSLPERDKIDEAARNAYELLSKPPAARPEEGQGRRLKHEAKKATEDDAQKVLNELSRMLLVPASAELGKKGLLIVADGALQYLPFAALPEPVAGGRLSMPGKSRSRKGRATSSRQQTTDSRQPLIVNHEIVSLPSA